MSFIPSEAASRAVSRYSGGSGQSGFTLTELLTVITIIIVLAVAIAPSLNVLGSSSFVQACSKVVQTMEEARAYAVAKHTYVYVGIGEFSAAAPDKVGTNGTGRLALFAIASRDGGRLLSTTVSGGTVIDSSNSIPISKLMRLDNIGLTDLSTNSLGGLVRSAGTNLFPGGVVDTNAAILFTFPQVLHQRDEPAYRFTTCVEFQPRGSAYPGMGANSLPGYLEIGLTPAKGMAKPPTKNVAVIQISGITGKATLLRP